MNWKNPEEVKAYQKAYAQKHKEKRKLYAKAYGAAHKEEHREYQNAYRVVHKEEMLKREKAYRDSHKEEIWEWSRTYYQRLKLETLVHYSTNPPVCAHCAEEDIDVLCIDHIENNGAEHRSILGYSDGSNFYQWLKKNGYPEGFQVLCCNCNHRKELQYRRTKWKTSKI